MADKNKFERLGLVRDKLVSETGIWVIPLCTQHDTDAQDSVNDVIDCLSVCLSAYLPACLPA